MVNEWKILIFNFSVRIFERSVPEGKDIGISGLQTNGIKKFRLKSRRADANKDWMMCREPKKGIVMNTDFVGESVRCN